MYCKTPRGMCHANDAWLTMLNDLTRHGKNVSPRGIPCQEIISYTSTIDMTTPVVTIPERKLGKRFMVAEAWWMLSGKNDVASIAPYSKTISKFSDDGRRYDGAYGVKIIDQLRYICDMLIEDNDTRQAVISIWRENPRKSKDVPCTLSCQFFIRTHDGIRYLDCCDCMRSSDAWLGVVYDWFNFSMLSAYVLLTIQERDESLKNVKLGRLHLTAGSAHLYESNMPEAYSILRQPRPFYNSYSRYEPLNISEFTGADDLVRHLACLKDQYPTSRKWLTELIKGPDREDLWVKGI